ncbi:MAG: DNA polymerase IV [Burkholderiales bacterium]|nr:DNA polymerase IV [Burkholderiales bacterium]
MESANPARPARYIAHLDMDAFYASVELLRYPQLRGRPVVVGGRRRSAQEQADDGIFATLRGYTGRGVVTTSTYEARALGVFSAMGLMKAAKLAPDAVLLPADFDAYRKYSRMFKEAVRAIAPQVEDRGIDEIYIDLSEGVAASAAEGAPDPWARARALALDIQRAVREATGLSCSIGITPNKLLSKIASELNKPGGISVIRPDDVRGVVWPLAARKINGIGPKANAKLERLGVTTIGELARKDEAWLVEQFGRSHGAWMHRAARGEDDRPVVTWSEPKSISRETTFEDDLHPVRDRARLTTIFTELCRRVADDLQRKGYAGKTIGLKIRYENFQTVTRDLTIDSPTQDATAIRRAAGECLKRVPLDRRIRLLGVRVGALSPPGAVTEVHAVPLFD